MQRKAGVVLPLFSIRTRRDWGIGQISDLPACAPGYGVPGSGSSRSSRRTSSRAGRRAPTARSPPSGSTPSTSTSTPIVDLDAPAIADALGDEGKRSLEKCRAAARVDYPEVRALKMRALRAAFERFHAREWARETPRARELAAFMQRERAWLDDLALYATLRESHNGWGWTTWPEPQRDRSDSRAGRGRARATPRRLLEVAYVQWTLHEQWEAARAAMSAARGRADGRPPVHRLRRERRRLVARLAVPAAHVARRAARRLLGRRAGLGPPRLRLARDGGRQPGLDPRAHAPRGAPLRSLPARSRRRLLPPVGEAEATAASAGTSIPRGWTRSAPAAGACSARCSRSSRTRTTSSRRGPSRRTSASSRRSCARCCASSGMPGYRVLPWEKGDDGQFRDPRSFPADSIVSWSTHDTAPIVSWWDELPEGDRAAARDSARACVPGMDERSRTLALLGDLYRASSNLALVLSQELLGRRSAHQHAGDRRRAELDLASARGPSRTSKADAAVMARFDARAIARRGVGPIAA